MMTDRINNRDWQNLSEYLDNQIEPKSRSALEDRLRKNPDLRQALEELRLTKAILRSQSILRAPRNFALKPEMVDQQFYRFKAAPVFRLASILVFLLLVFFLAGDFVTSSNLFQRSSSELMTEAVPIEPMMMQVQEEAAAEAPAVPGEGFPAEEPESLSEKTIPEESRSQVFDDGQSLKEPTGGGKSEDEISPPSEAIESYGASELQKDDPIIPELNFDKMETYSTLREPIAAPTFLHIPRTSLTFFEIILASFAAVTAMIFIYGEYKNRKNK